MNTTPEYYQKQIQIYESKVEYYTDIIEVEIPNDIAKYHIKMDKLKSDLVKKLDQARLGELMMRINLRKALRDASK
jgi:hypothetical protein